MANIIIQNPGLFNLLEKVRSTVRHNYVSCTWHIILETLSTCTDLCNSCHLILPTFVCDFSDYQLINTLNLLLEKPF